MWTRVEQLLVWLAEEKVRPLEHSMGNREFRWGCIDFGAESFITTSVSLPLLFFVDIVAPFYVACGFILYPIFFPYIYILVWFTILLNSIRQVHKFQKSWLPQPTHFECLTNHLSSHPIGEKKKNKRGGKKRKERKAQKEAGNKVP